MNIAKKSNEEHEHLEIKIVTIPSNGQICIGKKYAGHTFQIQFLSEGEILLKRGRFIPEDHETFYTDKAAKQLEEFDKWQKENPLPEDDESQKAIKDLIIKKKREKRR